MSTLRDKHIVILGDDTSSEYLRGFEAGRAWEMIQSYVKHGRLPLTITCHDSMVPVFRRMAQVCEFGFEQTAHDPGYAIVTVSPS